MGSMALGNAGSQFAVLGVALGAGGTMIELIDRVGFKIIASFQ